jgi:hypothetical protein
MKVNGNRMIRNTEAGAEAQRESEKEEGKIKKGLEV